MINDDLGVRVSSYIVVLIGYFQGRAFFKFRDRLEPGGGPEFLVPETSFTGAGYAEYILSDAIKSVFACYMTSRKRLLRNASNRSSKVLADKYLHSLIQMLLRR